VATVRQLLDGYVARRVTLDQLAANFRARRWPTTVVDEWAVEDPPPSDDSFDVVAADSRLTAAEYARLQAAYRTAVSST